MVQETGKFFLQVIKSTKFLECCNKQRWFKQRKKCFKIQGTKTPFVLFHSPWKDTEAQPQDCVQHQISSAAALPHAQHVTHSLRTLTDKVDSYCQRAYITLDFLAIEKKEIVILQ